MIETYSKIIPISSATITIDQVKQIYSKCYQLLMEAAEREVSYYSITSENDKKLLNASYGLSIVIRGTDGSVLSKTNDPNIFTSSNLPSLVQSIFFDSKGVYKSWSGDREPLYSFKLLLDFTEPRVLDWQNHISAPTHNQSFLEIYSKDNLWLAGLRDAVFSVIENAKNKRIWLHKAFVYDLGLWFIGIPLSIYFCSNIFPVLEKYLPINNPVSIWGPCIYIFLLLIFGFRLLFGSLKSLWPPIELINEKSLAPKRRKTIWIIIATFILPILSECIKKLLL